MNQAIKLIDLMKIYSGIAAAEVELISTYQAMDFSKMESAFMKLNNKIHAFDLYLDKFVEDDDVPRAKEKR